MGRTCNRWIASQYANMRQAHSYFGMAAFDFVCKLIYLCTLILSIYIKCALKTATLSITQAERLFIITHCRA